MLTGSSVYRVLIFSCACFLTIGAFAKLPASSDSANQVVVDVVVTDANHHPVKGLTERDFRVLENNKPQQIRSFEVHGQGDSPTAASPSPSANTFTNAGFSPMGSFNVVLLDQLNTSIQDQALAVRELNDFLGRKPADAAYAIFSLRNDDVACKPYRQDLWSYGSTAVEIPDWDSGCASMGRLLLVQGFTADKDRLMAAVQGNDSARPHVTFLRAGLSNVAGGGACGFPSGYDRNHYSYGFHTYYGGDYYNGGPAQVIDTTMPSLAELGNMLQALPGRKSLIWMSDNFDAAPIPQPSEMWFPPKFTGWDQTDVFSQVQMTHLAASRIAQARVAIYPVDLTGKSRGIDVKRAPQLLALECLLAGPSSNAICQSFSPNLAGLLLPQSSLFPNGFFAGGFPILSPTSSDHTCDERGPKLDTVASQTGGQAFHKADNIQNALTVATTDTTNYYTVSYVPTTKFDGKRREIKVVLAGKDYHLKYHESYFSDDRSMVNRPDGNAVADVYLPNPRGPMPWIPLRTAPQVSSQSNQSQDPILAAMEYGMPESRDLVFSAHLEPTQNPSQATPAQMAQLQDFESFKAERIAKAMENLTKEEKKAQHKGRTVLPPLDSLPAPDPVLLQPYSIDYSIPAAQLAFKKDGTGNNTLKLKVAILAFDAMGKKITGLQQVLDVSLSAHDLEQLQTSGYQLNQKLDVPDRATVLRLAIRDESGGNVGSLEVPLWAIQSPYRRKQLTLPVDVGKSAAEQAPPAPASTH